MHNCLKYFLLCLLMFIPVSVNAEVVILKSGKALEGRVIENTEQAIKIDVLDTGGMVILSPEEVEMIKPDSASVCPVLLTRLLALNEELRRAFSLMFSKALPLVTPDSAQWPPMYYYRNKDSDNLIVYVSALLQDPLFLANSQQVAYFARFFSAALHEDPKKIDQILSFKNTVGEAEAEWLDLVSAGARNFEILQPDTADNIELLWADFMATGDSEVVKRILTVLALPPGGENTALINKAEISLFLNSLKNNDIEDIVKKEGNFTGEVAKQRIEAVFFLVDMLRDSAEVFQHRGYNYEKLKQDNEAFASYYAALCICPGYTSVLNNLGNLYKSAKKDKQKSFLYIKSALYCDPDNPIYAYNLGIHFFENGQNDEAIKYYSRALEYKPNKPEYNHAIARAYQEKGDAGNAVKYFKQYLFLSPHGEHEHLVKAYLESVQAVTFNAVEDIDAMLKSRDYDELESSLESLFGRSERDENGLSIFSNEIDQLVKPQAMGVSLEERLNIMDRWIEARPNSHFANLVLGVFYIDYAWEARGAGFRSTVIEGGKDLFIQRLLEAYKYLAKAYELNPLDAITSTSILRVAIGLSFDFDEMEEWFQRAIKSDPNEYKAYSNKLKYLMPKWHGSYEQMFAFARDSAKKAPPGTLIPIILAEAHWEMHWRDDTGLYFKDNSDSWSEVKEVYERILRYFPGADYHRNKFALAAYYANDFTTARYLFASIGDKWNPEVWKDVKSFERIRDEVSR